MASRWGLTGKVRQRMNFFHAQRYPPFKEHVLYHTSYTHSPRVFVGISPMEITKARDSQSSENAAPTNSVFGSMAIHELPHVEQVCVCPAVEMIFFCIWEATKSAETPLRDAAELWRGEKQNKDSCYRAFVFADKTRFFRWRFKPRFLYDALLLYCCNIFRNIST